MASRKDKRAVGRNFRGPRSDHAAAQVAQGTGAGDRPGRRSGGQGGGGAGAALWRIRRLDACRMRAPRSGAPAGGSSASRRKPRTNCFGPAHDIKGEAATFGYPGVGGVADSLCRLIEHTPDRTRIPLALVDQHVDAVRAIAREYARPDLDAIAKALTRRLSEVTDEFLRTENSDRPDYLESIFAPPLRRQAVSLTRFEVQERSQAARRLGRFGSILVFELSATSSSQNIRASSRAASVAKRRSSVSSGANSPRSSLSQRVSTRSIVRRFNRAAPPGSLMSPPSRNASIASLKAG